MAILKEKPAAPAADPIPPTDPLTADDTRTAVDYGKQPKQDGPATKPDWLPEKFWKDGKIDQEGLSKSYTEVEQRFMKKTEDLKVEVRNELFKERPEAPDKYEVKPIEGVDGEALNAHPSVKFWREMAHESGLSNDKFNAGIQAMVDILMDGGVDTAAELAKLGDNAKVRTSAVESWAKATFEDPEEYEAVRQVAKTAAGIKAIERLMGKANLPDKDDLPGPTIKTLEELRTMMRDQRYWGPHKDPAYVKEVDEGFAKLAASKKK
jgi:hypothetical protein